MKKVILIIAGVAICSCMANKSMSQNLRQYYALRDSAIDYIVTENFDSAAFYYRQAFAHKEYPFYLDVANAMFCELKRSAIDTNVCRSYLMMIGGVDSRKYTDMALCCCISAAKQIVLVLTLRL
jgi:hypothetical protein